MLYQLVRKRWLPWLAGIGSIVTLILVSAPPASAHPSDDRRQVRPTIVLVHGAWAGPVSWARVVAELHADGYRTATPSLDLRSVQGDVATVSAALDHISGPKVVVAHSYGGVVASDAVANRSDVTALVYSAAFVPNQGDSIASLGAGFTQSDAYNHLVFTGAPFASPAYIDPAFFHQYFAQDLPRWWSATLSATQRPLNFAIVTTPSGPVGWKNIPTWYAVSGADRMIDPAEERWMAQRIGATKVEFDNASHVGGITLFAPQFTRLIERAAAATRRHS